MAFAGTVTIANNSSQELFAAAGITPSGTYKIVLTTRSSSGSGLMSFATAANTVGAPLINDNASGIPGTIVIDWDDTPIYVYNQIGGSNDFGFAIVPIVSTVKITTC